MWLVELFSPQAQVEAPENAWPYGHIVRTGKCLTNRHSFTFFRVLDETEALKHDSAARLGRVMPY